MKYVYYPGCASEATTREAMDSTKAVCKKLGIELVELEELSCCGAGCVDEINPDLAIGINARNFAIAEKLGLDILTSCNTCLNVMETINEKLKKNPALLEKTNKTLKKIGLKYTGDVKVKHFLWVIVKDYGLDKLKENVKKPLTKLKVAPFYGCHILRPVESLKLDDPEDPKSLHHVITTLGGEVVEFDGLNKCCGFHIMLVDESATIKLTGRYLKNAKNSKADIMTTTCPLCHLCLDTYQKKAEKMVGKLNLPVLHLSQLVGLAIGIKPSELKLSRHFVSTRAVVKRI